MNFIIINAKLYQTACLKIILFVYYIVKFTPNDSKAFFTECEEI